MIKAISSLDLYQKIMLAFMAFICSGVIALTYGQKESTIYMKTVLGFYEKLILENKQGIKENQRDINDLRKDLFRTHQDPPKKVKRPTHAHSKEERRNIREGD